MAKGQFGATTEQNQTPRRTGRWPSHAVLRTTRRRPPPLTVFGVYDKIHLALVGRQGAALYGVVGCPALLTAAKK